MATLAAHQYGSAYDQDKLTVHNIIIRNIFDGSGAYTYVKPYIKRDYGMRYIKALQERYKNSAMHEQYVNKSKRTIEYVAYRNERAMKSENFVIELTQAVDELENHNWGLHHSDVVDIIRKKWWIQN